MWRSVSTLLIAAVLSASCGGATPGSRVSRIRQRGFLVCGVFPGIAGFAHVDGQGHYTGFDVDFCRAVAAAIVGSAERIRYQPVASIDLFQRSSDIDIVSRRLTWSLRREGLFVLRSEEHTSELQSRRDLVCRLLLEKKKRNQST